ncbi:MAG: hypothetical protein ACI9QD_000316 [Thermoproteota archaeon]|jgi:hypothetical protein
MEYKTFEEFYPYYLEDHSNTVCRVLHFVGTFLLLLILVLAIITRNFKLLIILPLVGYGFAWVGHFVFEKNRPATFKYPAFSLKGDFLMFWQLLTGKISFNSSKDKQ